MANIFQGTEPPIWLQRLTEQTPGLLGNIFGELVGGLANSSEIAIKTAQDKQAKGIDTNWIKELPGSIKPGLAEARLNVQNPLWKMQAQQAQLNMAQQGLAMQNQQSLIDSRKTALQMTQHDQEVLPKWLQEHPTWESRQDAEPPQLFTTQGQRMFRDVQLGDAGNIKHKAIVEGIDAYAKSVAKLQEMAPEVAAEFATQIGKVPTPDLLARLGVAMEKAKAKEREELKTKVETIDLGGGKSMTVIYNPKTGHYEQPKQSKEEEVASEVKKKAIESELTSARQRVHLFESEMAKVTGTTKQANERRQELQKEYLSARKYYNDLLKKAKGTEAAPTQGTAPAAAPTAIAPSGINFDDFQNWRKK